MPSTLKKGTSGVRSAAFSASGSSAREWPHQGAYTRSTKPEWRVRNMSKSASVTIGASCHPPAAAVAVSAATSKSAARQAMAAARAQEAAGTRGRAGTSRVCTRVIARRFQDSGRLSGSDASLDQTSRLHLWPTARLVGPSGLDALLHGRSEQRGDGCLMGSAGGCATQGRQGARHAGRRACATAWRQ